MFAVGVFWLVLIALVAVLISSSYAFYRTSSASPGVLELADPRVVAQTLPQRTKRILSLLLAMVIGVGLVLLIWGMNYATDASEPPWDPDVTLQTLTIEGEGATSKGAGTTNLRLVGNFANDVILRSLDRSHTFRTQVYEPNERVAVSVRKLERTSLIGDDDIHLQRLKFIAVTEDSEGDTRAIVREYSDIEDDGKGYSLDAFAQHLKETLY
jgi:hypothetical protein